MRTRKITITVDYDDTKGPVPSVSDIRDSIDSALGNGLFCDEDKKCCLVHLHADIGEIYESE